MCQETSGYWMGPMPVQEYLKEFLPLPKERKDTDKKVATGKKVGKGKGKQKKTALKRPDIPPTYFKNKKVSKESDIYDHLIDVFNGKGKYDAISPGYILINTSQNADPHSRPGSQVKVDINEYRKGVVSKMRPNDMGAALVSYECKLEDVDLYCSRDKPGDDEAPFEANTKEKNLIRGQLATYATEVCRRQHRTHFFMVYIFHPFVRFIRWDRSGIIVSEKFDYTENCTPLIDFMWRFGNLDDVDKGFDPTVTLASANEDAHAREFLAKWKPSVPRPVFKMEVPDNDTTRHFLVWGSLAEADSPLGRATKGYPAVEVLENGTLSKKPVFLKEQWRSENVDPEMVTLRMLNDAHVINVPTLVCGGDLDQQTRSSDFAKEDWRLVSENQISVAQIERRVHTRLVVDEVGTPLERFESSREMLQAVYHAFLGHKDAIEKCGLLHRDVSAGNILILDDGRGMLNDWDLARKLSDLGQRARCSERTGTWPFMSIELLGDPTKIHAIRDDMESFYWIVLYTGLVYVPHTMPGDLWETLKKIFYDYGFTEDDGLARGGHGKNYVLDGNYIGSKAPNFKFCDCLPLTTFVQSVARELRRWKHQTIELIEEPEAKNSDATWCADPLKKCHKDMDPFFVKALEESGWPKDDKATNQVLRRATGPLHAGHRLSMHKRSAPDEQGLDPGSLHSDKKPKRSHPPPPPLRRSGRLAQLSRHSSGRR